MQRLVCKPNFWAQKGPRDRNFTRLEYQVRVHAYSEYYGVGPVGGGIGFRETIRPAYQTDIAFATVADRPVS